jgi:hypothetical protein
MIGPAKIEARVSLRGVDHFVVVFREEPDVIYALRDEGVIWDLDEGPPAEVARGAAII